MTAAKEPFKHNRRIGQNFLIDTNYIDLMLREAQLRPDSVCLEIGPGQGVLTRKILEEAPGIPLFAVEVDPRLEPYLAPLEEASPNLQLHWGDAVQFDYTALDPAPTQVIANIPYHITTPLLWKILEDLAPRGLQQLFLMVQKEAALRLQAPPGTKERYPLGVTLEAMGTARILRTVPPQAFSPRPKVDSAVISIELNQHRTLPRNRTWRSLLTQAFAQRRKTLANNLKHGSLLSPESLQAFLEAQELPPKVRAEALTVENWLALEAHIAGAAERREEADS